MTNAPTITVTLNAVELDLLTSAMSLLADDEVPGAQLLQERLGEHLDDLCFEADA